MATLRESRSAVDRAPAVFGQMFFESPVGMALADEHGRFIAVNPALCRLFGRPEQEIIGSSSVPFTHPDDLVGHGQAGTLVRTSPDGVAQVQKRFVRPSGEVRWAWLSFSHTAGPAGEEWTIGHMQDVTDLVAADVALRDSEQRLRSVIDVVRSLSSSGDIRSAVVAAAMTMIDIDGAALVERSDDGRNLIVTATTRTESLGGRMRWEPDSAITQAWESGTPATLNSVEVAADPLLKDRPGSLTMAELDIIPVRLEQTVVALLVVGSVIAPGPAGLDPTGLMPLLASQTAMAVHQATLMRRLERLATTDDLSGLPNRRSWSNRLTTMMTLALQTSRPLVVALADLDHFKSYNDIHGHLRGDELIRVFATNARAALQGLDPAPLLSRWGGEEFALARILDDPAGTYEALQLLAAAVPDEQTCSIGFAIWDGLESAESLMSRVDHALYQAKLNGRNTIHGA